VTSWEIIAVLAGIPLAVMVLLGLLTLVPDFARNRRNHYHSGQPWNHQPVWWTADPQALAHSHHDQPGTAARYGGSRGNW
jgi:hypothetical protein